MINEKLKSIEDRIIRCDERNEALSSYLCENTIPDVDTRRTYASVASRPPPEGVRASATTPARQRGRPAVMRDNQLRPPRREDILTRSEVASGIDTEGTSAPAWTPGRRRRDASGRGIAPNAPAKAARRRLPRNAAITIATGAEGMSQCDALRTLRSNVDLAEMEIDRTSIRRTAGGDALILVHGPNCAEKADRLAEKARHVLRDGGVRVTRPVRRADVRVVGIDESIDPAQLANRIAALGGCGEAAVRVNPFKREFFRNGQGLCWVNMPLDAAIRASSAGRLLIGWSSARVEMTAAKPAQCHKCWSYGHVRAACTSKRTLTGNCFNCGGEGHQSSGCEEAAVCFLCADRRTACDHRMGTKACASFADAVRAASGNVARPLVERR